MSTFDLEGQEPDAYIFLNNEVTARYGNPSGFDVLTEDQVDFYKSHPTASISEIRNLKLDEPESENIDDFREYVRKVVRNKFMEYIQSKVDYNKLVLAILVQQNSNNELMDSDVSSDMVDYYQSLYSKSHEYLLRLYSEINNCTAVSELDEVMSSVDFMKNIVLKDAAA